MKRGKKTNKTGLLILLFQDVAFPRVQNESPQVKQPTNRLKTLMGHERETRDKPATPWFWNTLNYWLWWWVDGLTSTLRVRSCFVSPGCLELFFLLRKCRNNYRHIYSEGTISYLHLQGGESGLFLTDAILLPQNTCPIGSLYRLGGGYSLLTG